MKIKISKESLISFLVLLPYLAGRISNQLFYIKLSPNAYIMPIMGVVFLFIILFFALNLIKQRKLKPRNYVLLTMLILLDAAAGIAIPYDKITAFSVWLRLCLPIILSLMIVKYCRTNNLDFGRILEGMLKWFTLYTALILTYFVLFRGIFSNGAVRFNPRGGGSVIFGYTIAVVFALALCLKERLRHNIFYLILSILTVAAIATGSRGAVWPIALMWVLNFMMAKLTTKKVLAALALTCVALFLSAIDIGSVIKNFSMTEGNIMARLFRVGSVERENSSQSLLHVIEKLGVMNLIFGFGTGGLFPLQRWELQGGDMSDHYFNVMGESVLVQPHNTFLYALMENGWIGFALWALLILSVCRLLIKNKNNNYVYQIIFVGTIVFVNLFDSIMFIQPGVATAIWLMLWCICEQSQSIAEKEHLDL